MKENISKHIIELLKHHDCVVLPNFGGLILKPVSATLSNNKFSPPSKKLAFNQSLKTDDGLLTGALMGSTSLTYSDAKSEIYKFSNSLAYQLKKEKQVEIEGLGQFIEINQQLKFQPLTTNILNKSSYGLPAIELSPIHREILEQKRKLLDTKKTIVEKKSRPDIIKKSYKLHFSLFFVIVMIGLLSSFIFSKNELINNLNQNAGFIDLFFTSDTPQLNLTRKFNTTSSFQSILSQRELLDSQSYQYLNIINESIPKGFIVVVGSYASQTNAVRMENKLFNDGFDSYILPSENGFHRVGIYVSENLTEAVQTVENLQAQYKGAWLVRNN